MSEVIDELNSKIQGFPKGDYLKTWEYSNGKVIAINSDSKTKSLCLCYGDKNSNVLHRLGRIDRDKINIFLELFVQGGIFKN